MQKIIKLTDTHYIVVDDSEIKEGNWVCNIQRPYAKQCQDWECTITPENKIILL